MNLVELYKKVPVNKHQNIKVIGNIVLYDAGTDIFQAYLDDKGELIPGNQRTKTALKALNP